MRFSARLALATGAALIGVCGAGVASAQTYNPGDRVECNVVGSAKPEYEKYYEKGTVLAFRPGDGQDGSWYRVKADVNGVEYYCKVEVIRAIAQEEPPPPPPARPATTPPRAPAPMAQQRQAITPTPAALPTGGFLNCPIQQPKVKNGARPDPELLKKIIRCAKGEKAVPPGDEGAVQVDVHSVQIGASRTWSYRQDSGNGQVGTLVYPVRATYTIKTLYRAATEVEENWIRTLNFYVNPFGEWQIGSEETVKGGAARRIPRT